MRFARSTAVQQAYLAVGVARSALPALRARRRGGASQLRSGRGALQVGARRHRRAGRRRGPAHAGGDRSHHRPVRPGTRARGLRPHHRRGALNVTEHSPSLEAREPEHARSAPPAPHGAPRRTALEGKTVPIVVACAVGAVLLGGGLLIWHAESKVNKVALAEGPKPVTVTVAKAKPYQPSRTYVGTLEPWLDASIGPQLVSAYVDTVLVRPGAVVKRGEVLATLDCRDASAASQAVAMQARAIDARQKALASESARVQGLLDGGFVSPNEAEQKAGRERRRGGRARGHEGQALAQHAGGQRLRPARALRRRGRDAHHRTPAPSCARARPSSRSSTGAPCGSRPTCPRSTSTSSRPRRRCGSPCPRPSRSSSASSRAARPPPIPRRAPSTSRSTCPIPKRSIPVGTTGEVRLDVGEPEPATEIPLFAASVRGEQGDRLRRRGRRRPPAHRRRQGRARRQLFVDTSLAAGTSIVTEGRALLDRRRPRQHQDGSRRRLAAALPPCRPPPRRPPPPTPTPGPVTAPAPTGPRSTTDDRPLAAQPHRRADALHRRSWSSPPWSRRA